MFVVHVAIEVNPEHEAAFIAATLADVETSRRDPGVVAFELYAHEKDSTRFVLWETYRSRSDAERHLETEHFQSWKRTIAPMLKRPPDATLLMGVGVGG